MPTANNAKRVPAAKKSEEPNPIAISVKMLRFSFLYVIWLLWKIRIRISEEERAIFIT